MRRYQIEWLLLGIALLIVGAIAGSSLYLEYSRIDVLERDRLQAQARVVDENLVRQLEGANNALVGIRDYLSHGNTAPQETSSRLKALTDAMPGVRTMFVTNASGTVMASSRDELIGGNVAHREYFKIPRERADPGVLYVAPPFMTSLGVYTINIVRAVTSAGGEFTGIVSATLDPEYFAILLKSVLYAPGMRASVIHGDGRIVLEEPNRKDLAGTDLTKPGSRYTRHVASGQASNIFDAGTAFTTGDERMSAWRTIRPAPLQMNKDLMVSVNRDMAGIFASWRRDVYRLGGLFGALLLTSALGLLFHQRRNMAQDRIEARYEAERKLGEESRKESEERYRTVADFTYDWEYWVLPDGSLPYVSPSCERITGYRAEEFKRDPALLASIVHCDDREMFQAHLNAVAIPEVDQGHHELDFRIVTRLGEERWIGHVCQHIYGRDGKHLGRRASNRDVTKRKRDEAERRTLSRAVEQSPVSIVITNRSGDIEYVNPRFESATGYTRAEALGKNPRILKSGLTPAQTYEDIWKTITQGGEWRGQLCNRRKDGELFWESAAISGLRDENGGVAHFIAVKEDVTERQRAQNALRQNEARFRSLTEMSSDFFWETDAEHRFTEDNAAVNVAVRPVWRTQIGQRRWELPYLSPDEAGWEAHRAILEAHQPFREFELSRLGNDGTVHYLSVSGDPIFDTSGAFKGYHGVGSDITERKRLEVAHLQAQKLESLGTLAGGIAHDFNNILAAIKGNAELAAEDVGPDHLAAESLKEIRKASERASELVRRITTFARPKEAGIAEVDLRAVVAEVLQLLRSTLPAAIALSTEFDENTPWVVADAGQIHEAIVNLTTNATHAIGPRPGSIKYRLEPFEIRPEQPHSIFGLPSGRYVCLTVTDSGCGMDAATMERIFDAFYTTKPLGEGTGLGLSMVHGIMKGHGGAVTVESAPGKGSSFRLYFPAAGEARHKPAEPATEREVPVTARRVLYVDDEEALVSVAQRVLSRLGHSIRGFTDPQQALAAFRAAPQEFDLVVTDLSMPHMSGFDLARKVMALRPGMPILMTTGYIRNQDEALAREAGIRELVLKPFSVDSLGAILNRLLQDAKGETGNERNGARFN